MKDLIVFTDYGTNPDDLLALMMLSALDDFKVHTIVSVGDPKGIRAQQLKNVLSECGLSDSSVLQGESKPLTQSGKFRWLGYEGHGLDPVLHDIELARTVLPKVLGQFKTLYILSIGPLTDVALYLESMPEETYIFGMGGALSGREYNFCADPEATLKMLQHKMKMVPLELSQQFYLRDEDWKRLQIGNKLMKTLKYQWEQFQSHYSRDKLYLHDPTAVVLMAYPEAFVLKKMQYEILTIQNEITLQTHPDEMSSVEVPMGVDRTFLYETFLNLVNRGSH